MLSKQTAERAGKMTKKMMEKVSDLFGQGYAPSQIDKKLRLDDGVAHDVIVESWAADWGTTGVSIDRAVVIELHNQGLAPSQIDKRLRLAAGTAHDEIVKSWAEDSRRQIAVQKPAKTYNSTRRKRCA